MQFNKLSLLTLRVAGQMCRCIARNGFKASICAALALLQCTGMALAAEKIGVFVSIVPQKYFVEKIGGDHVDVQVMVQPGASPATYEPKPKQMAALSASLIYFAIGVPFESVWLEKVVAASPAMLVCHTDSGITKIPMLAHRHDGSHHHDPELRGIPDPHIWLSPLLVKIVAGNILEGLLAVDPEHSAIYEVNHTKFLKELDMLDAELRRILTGKKGLRFMVFHPAWGYFAQTYGLEQVSIELEGKAPKPAQLQELIANAQKDNIRIIFVQPQFSARTAQTIAQAIGGEVLAADPLAEDWADNLRRQAEKFKTALR